MWEPWAWQGLLVPSNDFRTSTRTGFTVHSPGEASFQGNSQVLPATRKKKADEWPMAALCCASAQSEHCLRLHQSITGACGDGGSSGAENLPSEFATLQLAGHAAHLPPCLSHDNPLVTRTAAALPPAGVCGRSQQRRRGCRHAAAASSRRRCRRARRPSAKQP